VDGGGVHTQHTWLNLFQNIQLEDGQGDEYITFELSGFHMGKSGTK
jgi:hypothetical protein